MTRKVQADKEDRNETVDKTTVKAGIAGGLQETVGRFGSANAEFVKGYTGVDHETGQHFARGHKQISNYKVNLNPKYAEQNIKQQAGFSAEVAATSKNNAENIIDKRPERTARTDDVDTFGSNHPKFDLLELDANGNPIAGTGVQVKYVNNPNKIIGKIAKGQGGGKNDLSRYRDGKLALPSEQVDAAKAYCAEQSQKLLKQAERLEKDGKPELAAQKRRQAKNYETIHDNICDNGLSTEEAIFYREHPKLATAKDIGKVSHRAGIDGAKFGAAIGCGIAVLTNAFALCQGKKEIKEALLDFAGDTAKSAAVGYGTAFAGSAIKGMMQQSGSTVVRTVSKTSLPSLVVSVSLELGTSIKRLARGEIDRVQFMEEIGEKGSSLLSSGMMATVGQIAIPIPIVGGVIGGMIGCTLSAMFYRESLNAFKEAKAAHADYLRIKAQCEEARAQMEHYQAELQALFDAKISNLRATLDDLFGAMDSAAQTGEIDAFCATANRFGEVLGHKLQFVTMREFEDFMASDESFVF
ncbi:MAG: hypothetical protein LBP58_01550 [Azoarcus sp.]|jgi:hypothetical protein|nr:hypothetical protein [Azoarcus sp.]